MGKEARVIKRRTCRICHATFRTSAKDLQDHENVCKRMKALGLELAKTDISEV
jgi:cytochrome c5